MNEWKYNDTNASLVDEKKKKNRPPPTPYIIQVPLEINAFGILFIFISACVRFEWCTHVFEM